MYLTKYSMYEGARQYWVKKGYMDSPKGNLAALRYRRKKEYK